jgi:hypothetical protein
MSANDQYRFSNLGKHNALLSKITKLEVEMAEEIGEEVRLIAYTPKSEKASSNPSDCRAGLSGE